MKVIKKKKKKTFLLLVSDNAAIGQTNCSLRLKQNWIVELYTQPGRKRKCSLTELFT